MNIAMVSLVAVFATVKTLATASPANDYEAISRRNVFGLKEPPQPIAAPPTNPALPKVYLTGIATLNGKRVFLRTAVVGKAGSPAGEQSLMLGLGEKEADIEVLEIDEVAGRVKIRQAGQLVELTFDKDAPKSNPPANVAGQSAPAENPPPGANQGQVIPPPVQTPPPASAGQNPYLGKRMLPSRNLTQPAPPPPLPTAPGATTRPSGTGQTPAQNQLTPEEQQQLLNEVEHLKNSPY